MNQTDRMPELRAANHLPVVAMGITAATWAGFAIWLATDPDALLKAFGIESSTSQMRTEIRAFYGGVEMGIAFAMVVLWRLRYKKASLLVGSLPLIGSASGRCFGMMADGFSTVHLGFAALEVVGAVFCFAGYRLLDRTDAES